MGKRSGKNLIFLIAALTLVNPAMAESLFKTGVSQNIYAVQPRSLFSTVRAKTIGDIITVIINQNISASDNVNLNVKKSSDTDDKFSGILNDIFKTNNFPNVDGFGGGSQTKNQTSLVRNSRMNDIITAQVVQILPNGNLLIQGKKVAVNSGERVELILSGIVDPRLLNNQGNIDSTKVANLQIAVVGKGSVSRSDSEGTFNKILRFLF